MLQCTLAYRSVGKFLKQALFILYIFVLFCFVLRWRLVSQQSMFGLSVVIVALSYFNILKILFLHFLFLLDFAIHYLVAYFSHKLTKKLRMILYTYPMVSTSLVLGFKDSFTISYIHFILFYFVFLCLEKPYVCVALAILELFL